MRVELGRSGGDRVVARRVALVVACVLSACIGTFGAPAVSGETLVHRPAHLSAATRGTASSTNWSGYATYNGRFTEARAAWTQPVASCPSAGRKYASFWVGLDGYNSNSVEQIGTDSDCTG